MAGVDTTQPALPRERDQIAALLEMRWRLFTRNMQRDEEKVSFVLWLTGRILVFSFSVGAGCAAALVTYFAARGAFGLAVVFNFVFVGWQLLNLFRGALPNGVEVELRRFPLRFRTHVLLWLTAGAFEGLTLIGSWVCLGILSGLLLAGQSLLRSGLAVLLFYAINLLLTRAVFLWMSRMLASRRARDLVLIASSSLSILPQLLRMHGARVSAWMHRLPLPPWFFSTLHWTPGYLAARAVAAWQTSTWLALLAWAGALLAALLYGLLRAFRGDDVQEFAASAPVRVKVSRTVRSSGSDAARGSLVLAVAGCEWARLRHGGAALFAVASPLLYVVLFGLRIARGPFGEWMVPAAAAYIGLGVLSRAFNVFGEDGKGVQTYLMSPVPLRTALLGKNLFNALLYTLQVVAGTAILAYATRYVSVNVVLFTALWMVCYLGACFTLGNKRSIRAPIYTGTDKVTVREMRRTRRAGSGGWRSLAVIFGIGGLGAVIAGLCAWLHHVAWAPWCMLPFAVASAVVYRQSLHDPAYAGDIAALEPLLSRIARAT